VGSENPGLKAVLWDLDGTLLDTEPAWFEAQSAMIESFGGRWTAADHAPLVGSHLPDTAIALRAKGVDLPGEQIIEGLLDQVIENVRQTRPFTPGSLKLVAGCRAAGLAQALVTMSYRRFANLVEEMVPGGFDAVVCGDEVLRGKPDAEPYLAAARALGLEPAECLVIEDSPTGVTSALAAGMATVVARGLVVVDLQAGLSRVGSLKELGVEQLRAIHGGLSVDTWQ